jgi:ABC-type microcin C transport system duplicated ATPase subunit YejF
VFFIGQSLEYYKEKKRFNDFRKNIQFVFQNPYDTLNPRLIVRSIADRVIVLHAGEIVEQGLQTTFFQIQNIPIQGNY